MKTGVTMEDEVGRMKGEGPTAFETKDSGARRSFSTGAVRDKAEGKGRYDLLPGRALEKVAETMLDADYSDPSVNRALLIDEMLRGCIMVLRGDRSGFVFAVANAMWIMESDETGKHADPGTSTLGLDRLPPPAIRRLAQLYERGAVKYAERNWEKGMPLSVYLDSMTRHAFQASSGAQDEDHLAAVCFNGLAAIHFLELGRTELDDLPNKPWSVAMRFVPPVEDYLDYQIHEWFDEDFNRFSGIYDVHRLSDGASDPQGGHSTVEDAVKRLVKLANGGNW